MNKQLLRLSQIIEKPSRKILGLMSGTSLDGLDMALCECKDTGLEVLNFRTCDYNDELRNRLRSVQSKVQIRLPELCLLHTELAEIHAEMILQTLNEWALTPADIDLVASHGQTVYHLPAEEFTATLQITDGDHLAQRTGIITVSDFRQKHTAAGGQGAPLATLMDERLFRHPVQSRMLLNLGGIGNFTFLPPQGSPKNVIYSDTGPANTLINEAMQKYFGEPYDEDGTTAAAGKADLKLLSILLKNPFFEKPLPRTTGQEDFSLSQVEDLMPEHGIKISPLDLVATLTRFTVESIAAVLSEVLDSAECVIYISGGGLHNKTITKGIQALLPNAELRDFRELGLPPDAKEAALMAFLADEMLQGRPFQVHTSQVGLGKISLPD